MAEHIEPNQLVVNQIVMVVSTTSIAQGFIGKLFRVLAVDWPYGVLEWLESPEGFRSRHTVDLREFTFTIPTKNYVNAVLPDEVWPDIVVEEAARRCLCGSGLRCPRHDGPERGNK